MSKNIHFVSIDCLDFFILSRKQHFIVPAQMQWICIQRLSPKKKVVSLYVSLQAGYRGNKILKQGLSHI
jgi:hypothetical protein